MARREQWAFLAGIPPAASITSLSVSFSASSRVFPMANSVAMLEVEMAPGHPWVRNLKSEIFPSSHLDVNPDIIPTGWIAYNRHGVRVLYFSDISWMGKMIDQRLVIDEITNLITQFFCLLRFDS